MDIERIKEKLLDRFYTPEYLDILKRYDYILRKLRYLYREKNYESFMRLLKQEFKIELNPHILDKLVEIFKKFGIVETIRVIKRNKVPIESISVALFILFPEKIFPYTSRILEELGIKRKINFLEFQKTIQKVKNNCDFLSGNLDLYVLLNLDKIQNRFFDDLSGLISKIETIDFLKITADNLVEIKNEIDILSKGEKAYLYRVLKERISPYYLRLLVEDTDFEVIIDANNIVYSTIHPSLKNIFYLFECLSEFKYLLFPFTIVFDRNIKYLLPRKELMVFKERFETNPNVVFHSPADELIFEFYLSRKAFIISNDRFRQYEIKKHNLIKFKEGKLIPN